MLWLSLTFNVLLKALYQCNYATTAVAAQLVAAVGLQVQYGPQTEGRISQRVSGLSHDSMCGSWFSSVLKCVWCGLGLVSLLVIIICFIWIHLFLNLHVGVTATCSAGLLVCSFRASFFETCMFRCKYFHKCSKHTRPSLLSAPTPLSHTQPLSPTHPNALDHAQNLTSDPLTPHDSLSLLCCQCAASLADWLSCFLAVTESQWAGKERWQ